MPLSEIPEVDFTDTNYYEKYHQWIFYLETPSNDFIIGQDSDAIIGGNLNAALSVP